MKLSNIFEKKLLLLLNMLRNFLFPMMELFGNRKNAKVKTFTFFQQKYIHSSLFLSFVYEIKSFVYKKMSFIIRMNKE
jgi:hypothetical protein